MVPRIQWIAVQPELAVGLHRLLAHGEAVMFDLIAGNVQHAPRPHAVPLLGATVAHAVVAGAVAVPLLLMTGQLPEVPTMMAFVVAAPEPPPPPPPPPPPAARQAAKAAEVKAASPDAAPVEAPKTIQPEPPRIGGEEDLPEGVEGGVPGGVTGGVVAGIVGDLPTPPPPPPQAPPPPAAPVRVGGEIKAPALLRRVEPVYPGVAVSAHIEGLVILEATVNDQGEVTEVRVLRSTSPLLANAALDAVKEWRYSPLMLNGHKVKFILTVLLTFKLQDQRTG